MSPQLEEALRAKFPSLSLPRMECGDGWLWIVDRALAELQALSPVPVRVKSIGQKYGTLRISTHPYFGCDRYKEWSARLEAESETTCEICGQPGAATGLHWVMTRCAVHSPSERPILSAV